MDWIKSSSTIKPNEIDTTSSQMYVYVRKDIQEIVKKDEQSDKEYTTYEYMEKKVKKDDWDLYKSVMDNNEQTTDLAMTIDNILTDIIPSLMGEESEV